MAERFLPGHVGTHLAYALESGEEADRLFALQAANHADRGHDPRRTQYGLEVARIFLDQAGLGFEPAGQTVFRTGWDVGTTEKAGVMREVVDAVGPSIGVQSVFHEFVGRSEHKKADIVLVDGERLGKLKRGLDEREPYFIRHQFLYEASQQNLANAMEAIVGTGVMKTVLNDELNGAVEVMRGLDVVH